MPLQSQLRAVVDRLATDWRMDIVWKEVASYGPGKEADVIEHAFRRARSALNYWAPWPRRKKDQDARTLAELKELRELKESGAMLYSLENTATHASTLVELMQDTESLAKAFGLMPEEYQSLLARAQSIASKYQELSAQEKELTKRWTLPRVGKPGASDAPERAFSAAMSNDLQELLGNTADPAVAALTDVVFDSDKDKGTGSGTIRGRRRSLRRNILSKN